MEDGCDDGIFALPAIAIGGLTAGFCQYWVPVVLCAFAAGCIYMNSKEKMPNEIAIGAACHLFGSLIGAGIAYGPPLSVVIAKYILR